MSTRRRTPGVWASPTPLGPNGERLCRNCKGPMPEDKRKHNCSKKCSEEWACKTSPNHLRWVLRARDHGICALCGLDTLALEEAVKWVRDHIYKSRELNKWTHPEWYDFLRALGITHRWPGDLWDADHIVPVIEGGGECGPEGYRTLCIPCHKQVTKELAGRLAAKKAAEKLAPLALPLKFGDLSQIEAAKFAKRNKKSLSTVVS